MLSTLRVVTTRKQTEARLERIANYDELTGHFNKTRLRDELDQALTFARRFYVPGAFMVIGIDKLAMINSAFGYEVGDAVLVAVGQRLDRYVRSSDVVGRLGGDRFGVILSQCREEMVVHAMDRIIDGIREEPVEMVIAAAETDRDHLIAESADVLFHLLVLLKASGVTLADVEAALEKRTGMSGLEEKAARKRD